MDAKFDGQSDKTFNGAIVVYNMLHIISCAIF